MNSDLILVILYIASFAVLYSIFSSHVRRIVKSKRTGQAREEKVEQKEMVSEKNTDTKLSISSEEEKEIEKILEPVIVREEDNVRRVLAQLTQDELRVLRFLVEKGGECYQMEIYRTLKLPKSTVTKIVHRLSERGLLIIERRGRYNYVKLRDLQSVKNIVLSAKQVV